MKRGWQGVLSLGIALLLGAAPVIAHHSISAEFDTNNRVTFTGAVKKVDWMNPHIYTHVEVKEADGKMIVYKVEGGAPNALFRSGWRPDSLAVGEVVTCTNCSRAKTPGSMNVNGALTRADGARAFAGAGPASANAQQ